MLESEHKDDLGSKFRLDPTREHFSLQDRAG
jgi:hypothetical protein